MKKQVERQVKKEVHEEVARREAAALQESRISGLAGLARQARDRLGRSVSRDVRREEDLMNDASGEMM